LDRLQEAVVGRDLQRVRTRAARCRSDDTTSATLDERSTMLKVLHNHIFASKLRDVFTQSPLVLVYQTVGTVDVAGASARLQKQLDAQLPGSGMRVQVCRMRNSVAQGAGDPALQQLFQASNLLVGFGGPTAAAAAAAAAAPAAPSSSDDAAGHTQQPQTDGARAGRSHSVSQLLGSLFGSAQPASTRAAAAGAARAEVASGQQLSHKLLAKAFQLGADLPKDQPIVLLGAFYGRKSIQLGHLKQWVTLDESRVRRKGDEVYSNGGSVANGKGFEAV